jgi:HEAT repeat protein
MLEKESATERLKAVNLSTEMDEPSKKVTEALIETLNKDEQVNVRLAALEALKPYLRDANVRKALVESIANQESPMVQVALAEVMVALQAKESIDAFEKIIENEETPDDVKKRIEESIQTLI